MVRDLSTNGAFISGPPLPLLSRVAVKFDVKGIGTDRRDRLGAVAAHRRLRSAGPTTGRITLPKGFGVLFEAIPMEIALGDRRARQRDHAGSVASDFGRATAASRGARSGSAARSAPSTLATLGGAIMPLVTGALGVVLGSAYLVSPTWKLEVVVDDDALEVRLREGEPVPAGVGRCRPVVASPRTTCFVDGGAPERSLLVPGQGAPAPYDIEEKRALVAAILAHVDPAKVRKVASLQEA